jgi:hypothetical protein
MAQEAPFSAAVTAELWAHARELGETGARELSPPQLRRALVTLAVAGSGDDPAAFRAAAKVVRDGLRELAIDPIPIFDAASALVHEADEPAREALVTVPREPRGGGAPPLGGARR